MTADLTDVDWIQRAVGVLMCRGEDLPTAADLMSAFMDDGADDLRTDRTVRLLLGFEGVAAVLLGLLRAQSGESRESLLQQVALAAEMLAPSAQPRVTFR